MEAGEGVREAERVTHSCRHRERKEAEKVLTLRVRLENRPKYCFHP